MTTEALEYKVFGLPIEAKSYSLNDDNTLTIKGVASTTNKDYANEIVSPEVLESLAKQAPHVNLHLDHNKRYEGGIGSIVKAWIQDSQLWIEAIILSKYAKEIKERLDIGMNFGFSISGFPKKRRTPDGILIVDYDLKEISLTYIPSNWDTFGTVEYKNQNLIASNCLTGACYHALQNDGENMSEKNETKNEPIEEPVIEDKSNEDAGLSEAQKNQVKDIFNELAAEFEPRILELLEPKLTSIADSAADKAATAVADRILAEMKATEEVTSNDKDLNSEESEDEVEDDTVESDVIETEEDEVKSEPGIAEPTTEEEVDVKDETEPEEEDDSIESEDEEDDANIIDEKAIDEKIHNAIVKQMNEKSFLSKFDKFRKESKKASKTVEPAKPKRDAYGRNLNYI